MANIPLEARNPLANYLSLTSLEALYLGGDADWLNSREYLEMLSYRFGLGEIPRTFSELISSYDNNVLDLDRISESIDRRIYLEWAIRECNEKAITTLAVDLPAIVEYLVRWNMVDAILALMPAYSEEAAVLVLAGAEDDVTWLVNLLMRTCNPEVYERVFDMCRELEIEHLFSNPEASLELAAPSWCCGNQAATRDVLAFLDMDAGSLARENPIDIALLSGSIACLAGVLGGHALNQRKLRKLGIDTNSPIARFAMGKLGLADSERMYTEGITNAAIDAIWA